MHLYFLKSFVRTLLFAVCAWIGNAVAADLITSKAFVEDATGQKTLEQVSTETSTPYTGILSRGYTKSTLWVKLEITPPAGANASDAIVLRIKPVYLDEITLYDPLDKSGRIRKVGDTEPIERNEFTSLAHTFVAPAGEVTRTIWLKVKTTSTCLIDVEVLSREEMMSSEFSMNLVYFGVLALIGMFALLVLIHWFNHRESLYALFVAKQIYYFFYVACLFGMHRVVFSKVTDINLDSFFSWQVVIATAVAILFENRFLNEYSLPTWVKFVLNGLMLGVASVFVIMGLGYTRTALHTNMLINALSIPIWLTISILSIDGKKIQERQDKVLISKRMVVTYYSSIGAVMVFSFLPYLGVIQGDEFSVNGLAIYALCSGFIMTILMQLRSNMQRVVQADTEKKLLLSEQSVALEKDRREEQTHLFHMLMHELKTPLSIIDLALMAKNDEATTSDYVSRAVSNMKDILDRCVKADKLTEGSVDIRLQEINLNQYIQSLIDTQRDSAVVFSSAQTLHVKTDIQFLNVIVSNLLDNAKRYGDEREAIALVAAQKQNAAGESGVSLTISNRPSAASWPDAARVFSKYYRSAGAEAQSGTGLGLYLVRTLARLVGGDCLYVPDDRYVRFELWLPA